MKPFVLALATIGLVDSISYMIVTPSLIFYVLSLGGTQEIYGFVLAIYSFAAFVTKPVLGRWSDASNFRVPYMVSISFGVIGGLVYAIAPALPTTKSALAAVIIGRVLGGVGNANSALGFAYIARALPASERTSTTALLGGVQMAGMAIAPLFNFVLASVDFDFWGIHFDSLNSVGLFLVAINALSQVLIYILLPDLPVANESEHSNGQEGTKSEGGKFEWIKILKVVVSNPHVGVPFFTIFSFNFNWQFIETALSPASHDALGWGPVEASYVLGGLAFLVFMGMASVHQLSSRGVSDFKLLSSGLFVSSLGNLVLYFAWYRGVSHWIFVVPPIIAGTSFAFMGAPNRSLFSSAVDNSPECVGYEGTMQALLSMAASVGAFSAPSMIARYCLRTPEEVDVSKDGREFTPFALMCPFIGVAIWVATVLAGEPAEKPEKVGIDMDPPPDEATPLMFSSKRTSDLPPREIARRASQRASLTSGMTIMCMDALEDMGD